MKTTHKKMVLFLMGTLSILNLFYLPGAQAARPIPVVTGQAAGPAGVMQQIVQTGTEKQIAPLQQQVDDLSAQISKTTDPAQLSNLQTQQAVLQQAINLTAQSALATADPLAASRAQKIQSAQDAWNAIMATLSGLVTQEQLTQSTAQKTALAQQIAAQQKVLDAKTAEIADLNAQSAAAVAKLTEDANKLQSQLDAATNALTQAQKNAATAAQTAASALASAQATSAGNAQASATLLQTAEANKQQALTQLADAQAQVNLLKADLAAQQQAAQAAQVQASQAAAAAQDQLKKKGAALMLQRAVTAAAIVNAKALRQQVADLTNKLAVAQAAVATAQQNADAKIALLAAQLDTKDAEIKAAQKTNADASATFVAQQQTLSQIQAQNDQLKQAENDYFKNLADLLGQLAQTKAALVTAQGSADDLAKANTDIASLTPQLKAANDALETQTAARQTADDELVKLKQAYSDLQATNQSLAANAVQLQSAPAADKAGLGATETKLAQQQNDLQNQITTLKAKLGWQKAVTALVLINASQLRQQVTDLSSKLATAQNTVTNAQQDAELKIASLAAQLNAKDVDIEAAQQKNADASTAFAAQQQTLNQMQAQNAQLNQTMATQQVTISDLQKQLAQAQTNLANAQGTADDLAKAKAAIASLTPQLKAANDALVTQTAARQAADAKLAELTQAYNDLQATNQSLAANAVQLRSAAAADKAGLSATETKLAQQQSDLQKQITTLKVALGWQKVALKSQIQQLRDQLTQAQNNLDMTEGARKAAVSLMVQLRSQYADLQVQLATGQVAAQASQQQLAALQSQINAQQKAADDATQKNAAAMNDLQDKLAQALSQAQTAATQQADEKSALLAQINQLRDQLQTEKDNLAKETAARKAADEKNKELNALCAQLLATQSAKQAIVDKQGQATALQTQVDAKNAAMLTEQNTEKLAQLEKDNAALEQQLAAQKQELDQKNADLAAQLAQLQAALNQATQNAKTAGTIATEENKHLQQQLGALSQTVQGMQAALEKEKQARKALEEKEIAALAKIYLDDIKLINTSKDSKLIAEPTDVTSRIYIAGKLIRDFGELIGKLIAFVDTYQISFDARAPESFEVNDKLLDMFKYLAHVVQAHIAWGGHPEDDVVNAHLIRVQDYLVKVLNDKFGNTTTFKALMKALTDNGTLNEAITEIVDSSYYYFNPSAVWSSVARADVKANVIKFGLDVVFKDCKVGKIEIAANAYHDFIGKIN